MEPNQITMNNNNININNNFHTLKYHQQHNSNHINNSNFNTLNQHNQSKQYFHQLREPSNITNTIFNQPHLYYSTSSSSSPPIIESINQNEYSILPPNIHQQKDIDVEKMSKINQFWADQTDLIQLSKPSLREHCLPLARVKKIMKCDEDVKMISADAPIIFVKACELFILDLTIRSWFNTEDSKRRTLQKIDICQAVSQNEVFDFLIDIVPRDINQFYQTNFYHNEYFVDENQFQNNK